MKRMFAAILLLGAVLIGFSSCEEEIIVDNIYALQIGAEEMSIPSFLIVDSFLRKDIKVLKQFQLEGTEKENDREAVKRFEEGVLKIDSNLARLKTRLESGRHDSISVMFEYCLVKAVAEGKNPFMRTKSYKYPFGL